MQSPLQRLRHRVRSRLDALHALWRRGGWRALGGKLEQRWFCPADPLVALGRSATPWRQWQWQRQGRSRAAAVPIAVVILDPVFPDPPRPALPPALRRLWGLDRDCATHLHAQLHPPHRLDMVAGAIAPQPEQGWIAALDRAFAAGSKVVVVLWVGDRLAPHALLRVAQAALDPGFDLLYGDGVGMGHDGRERQWHLHPAFAPLDWQGRPYALEWWAIGREFWQREGRHVPWPEVAETGGDGAIAWGWWLYELGLRAIATHAHVRHIPEVLAWIQDRQLPPAINPDPVKLDPQNALDLDPSSAMTRDPQNALDLDPSSAMTRDPQNALDLDPSSAMTRDPQNALDLDPSPTLTRDSQTQRCDRWIQGLATRLQNQGLSAIAPHATDLSSPHRAAAPLLESQPLESQPLESQPVESQPVESQPLESQQIAQHLEPVAAYPAIRITRWDPPPSRVWVVIPTKNRGDLLRQCIDSLNATAESIPLHFAIVDHESDDPDTRAYLEQLRWTWGGDRLRIYRHYGPFNFSLINNAAIARLEAELKYEGLPLPEVYLLCNNDVEAIAPGWLTAMLTLLEPPDVGIVGIQLHYGPSELDAQIAPKLDPDPELARKLDLDPELAPKLDPELAPKLDPGIAPRLDPELAPKLDPELAPTDRETFQQPLHRPYTSWIQHAGVVVGLQGTAEHTGKFVAVRDPMGQINGGDRGRLLLDREVSAVTAACVAIRRSVWQVVGGFDSRYGVGFGDVDLCLRVRAAGYRVIQCNRAALVHHESLSRGKTQRGDPHPQDTDRFHRQWGHLIHDRDAYFQSGDPYFNPHWSISSYGWEPTPRMRWRSRPWVR